VITSVASQWQPACGDQRKVHTSANHTLIPLVSQISKRKAYILLLDQDSQFQVTRRGKNC